MKITEEIYIDRESIEDVISILNKYVGKRAILDAIIEVDYEREETEREKSSRLARVAGVYKRRAKYDSSDWT